MTVEGVPILLASTLRTPRKIQGTSAPAHILGRVYPARGHPPPPLRLHSDSSSRWGRHGRRSLRQLVTVYPQSGSGEAHGEGGVAGAQLAFSFLFILGFQLMRWHDPHLEWFLPPQLIRLCAQRFVTQVILCPVTLFCPSLSFPVTYLAPPH